MTGLTQQLTFAAHLIRLIQGFTLACVWLSVLIEAAFMDHMSSPMDGKTKEKLTTGLLVGRPIHLSIKTDKTSALCVFISPHLRYLRYLRSVAERAISVS